MVHTWYLLGSKFGAHARGPEESLWIIGSCRILQGSHEKHILKVEPSWPRMARNASLLLKALCFEGLGGPGKDQNELNSGRVARNPAGS